ncbi:hypothetical protein [Variovorax sp. J22R115]|uniref:hypothetical protein n=1 Tax=Variovorax sp. J22R115 TaxID=3053509 RepID=UPI0025787E4C|nr:hypothetical protein [Variovorax sp. J22R115]MDM0053802.1 hypothetical protein [Variovorax sp. J22R115]
MFKQQPRHEHDLTTVGVFVAYIKPLEQLALADDRLGPLQEYTREHAALYRSREAKQAAPSAAE